LQTGWNSFFDFYALCSWHRVLNDYPDDKPCPSALFLGWAKGEPFHVVAAYDFQSGYCFVITAYRPDLEHFESDYKTRRKHVD
jgi:hypothetical protein